MNKYKKSYLIKSYECDVKVKLRMRSLFNLFQDMADEHADEMGVGYHYCHERGIGWIGGGYHVRIHQRPTWDDTVTLTTWPSAATAATGIRDFQMTDKNGNTLIDATSRWVLVDINRMRPIPVMKHIPSYELVDDRAIVSDFVTIELPEVTPTTITFPVRMDDIDLNDHANNAMYPTWALDGLDEAFLKSHEPVEVQVSFKRPTRYRDVILLKTYQTEDTTVHVMTNPDETTEYARVRIGWRKES